MGSYPLILMIYNTALEIEWDKRNISFLPNFRASSVTKCIKKLLMAYSCMKRGFKHTINEIILIFSSLPCYVRKEKLGRGNFLCKTWKIFYDSLNFSGLRSQMLEPNKDRRNWSECTLYNSYSLSKCISLAL